MPSDVGKCVQALLSIAACGFTRTCRLQVDKQELDVADGAVDGTVDAHLEQVRAVSQGDNEEECVWLRRLY